MSKLIGTNPNQVPTNADLGTMAYMDYDAVAPVLIGGRRNMIINGAMQVAQRGTSATGVIANDYHTVDRWKYIKGTSSAVWTVEQSTDAPSGFGYSNKYTLTTASPVTAPSVGYIQQSLEGQDLQTLAHGTSGAKELTMSFWAKGNVTGTYICELRNADSGLFIGASYTISTADTWEYKQVSFVGDTSNGFDNDSAASLQVRFMLFAGSDYTSSPLSTVWSGDATARYTGQVDLGATVGNYIAITGVQLELGSIATPFEHRSYGEELALCQRYFLATELTTAWFQDNYLGASHYGTQPIPFPTTMRVTPTVIADTVTNWVSSNLSSVAILANNADSAQWRIRASSTGRVYQYYNANDGATFKFDAEL